MIVIIKNISYHEAGRLRRTATPTNAIDFYIGHLNVSRLPRQISVREAFYRQFKKRFDKAVELGLVELAFRGEPELEEEFSEMGAPEEEVVETVEVIEEEEEEKEAPEEEESVETVEVSEEKETSEEEVPDHEETSGKVPKEALAGNSGLESIPEKLTESPAVEEEEADGVPDIGSADPVKKTRKPRTRKKTRKKR